MSDRDFRLDPDWMMLDRALALYAELTGYVLSMERLLAELEYFNHLEYRVFDDPYVRNPGTVWNVDGPMYRLVGVKAKRFRHFITARMALKGSGKPDQVFSHEGRRPRNDGDQYRERTAAGSFGTSLWS